MGNDGGSIPKRHELVKEAARNPTTTQLKESIQEKQEYLWTTDPISISPLRPPIVSDCNGHLYNKDSILEYLLPSDDPDAAIKKAEAEKILAGAVKSLKDVVEVKFESDSQAKDGAKKWVCPITNKPIGPGSRAVYLVPCGHVFSEAAMKEISETKCLQCNESYAENDVIPLLSTVDTDLARLALRSKTLREKGLTHSLKKASGGKKRKKNNAEEQNESGTSKAMKSEDATKAAGPAGIKNSSTASLTAKVLDEQDDRNKKRKMQRNDNLNSLFHTGNNKPGKNNDYMTRGFSIPSKGGR